MLEAAVHCTAIPALWVNGAWVKTASHAMQMLPGVSLGTCWGLVFDPSLADTTQLLLLSCKAARKNG